MPAKGKKKVTDQVRAKIAKSRADGKTVKTIAREEGLGVSTVEKQLKDARTGSLYLDFKMRNRELWDKAMLKGLNRLVLLVDHTKDPAIMLRASEAILRSSVLGDVAIRPEPPKDPENRRRGDFTLEALVESYHVGILKAQERTKK